MTKPVEVLNQICSVPGTDEPLAFDQKGRGRSADGRRFRSVRGVPVLRNEETPVVVKPVSHVSSPIAQERIDAMCAVEGYSLLLGAGNTAFRHPKVIDVEFHVFASTDVVADAHCLPFHSDTFDSFFAMNVFEHLHHPFVAAQEVLRVLKPGGELQIHTAFLQPLHEEPNHFYNATEFGAREWLRGFESVECRVSPNFNPLYSVAWLADEILRNVEHHLGRDAARVIGGLSLAEVGRFWAHPQGWNPVAGEIFYKLPEAAQKRVAAGFELTGRKPRA